MISPFLTACLFACACATTVDVRLDSVDSDELEEVQTSTAVLFEAGDLGQIVGFTEPVVAFSLHLKFDDSADTPCMLGEAGDCLSLPVAHQLYSLVLCGDLNADGTIDTIDCTLWKDRFSADISRDSSALTTKSSATNEINF